MELSGGENIPEESFGGEKFHRTDNAEYGNLLAIADEVYKKVDYYKMTYTSELNGIPKRRASMKTSLIFNIIFTLFLVGVLAFLYFLAGSNPIVASTQMYIAAVILFIAIIRMLIVTLKSARLYIINTIPGKFMDYISLNRLNTLLDEKVYCEKVLKQMLVYEDTIIKIKREINNKTVDVESAKEKMVAMNFDIPDFNYNAGYSSKSVF